MDVNLDDVQNVLTMSTDDDMVEAKTFKTQNSCHRDKLIYGVTDAPPIYVTLLCGLQTVLITLTSALFVSLLVAEVVCASHNEVFKAKLFSSTLVMNGLTTLAMNVIGVRLPLFQGAAGEYAVPLLLIGSIDKSFCSVSTSVADTDGFYPTGNETINNTVDDIALERILRNVRSLQGSLMVAGVLHALVGLTGLVGYLLSYIGPITIVSSMFLLSVVLADACVGFVKGHWGIGLSTAGMGIVLSVYLSDHQMPIPIWTPSRGFRIIRYPLHQVFALLISVIINWLICGVLTHTGMLTDDPTNAEYTTRTDARGSVVEDSSWFNIPYPGQYGMISFSGAAFVAFFIATIISILDSMGDYFACARTCHMPAPPKHAVNRGILIEGLCTFLSGSVGCGHATTTYGDAIGALAITKVASRHVYICAGLLYILFGVVGKFSAAIITIPSPVLGGAAIIMFSTFLGVALSNLQVVSLSSSRNTSVLGIAIFLGLMIPMYVNKNANPFNTGNATFDRVLVMLFSNVNFCGPVLAFILDNTIPGSKEERGITAWQAQKVVDGTAEHDVDSEMYYPVLPKAVLTNVLVKYVPFLPHVKRNK